MTFSPCQAQALITGASSGIGRAVALSLAKVGVRVALVGRCQERLNTVVEEVEAFGGKAKAYPFDFTHLGDIKQHIEEIIQDFGDITVLINNAGMGYTSLLSQTPLVEWQKVMDLNLTSVFQCIQGVLPSMRRQNQGLIVNIASIAAYNAFPEWGAYTVSKAGIVAFSKVLAAEERKHGIRVMIVSPGAVNTPIWDTQTVQTDFDRSKMLTPEIVAQSIVQAILLPAEAVIEEMTIMPTAGVL